VPPVEVSFASLPQAISPGQGGREMAPHGKSAIDQLQFPETKPQLLCGRNLHILSKQYPSEIWIFLAKSPLSGRCSTMKSHSLHGKIPKSQVFSDAPPPGLCDCWALDLG